MMNLAYADSCNVEVEAFALLDPLLTRLSFGGQVLTMNTKETQMFGDRLLATSPLTGVEPEWVRVEVKAEQKPSMNLFLEAWSNKSRGTPGWMYTEKPEWFWYLFLGSGALYTIIWDQLVSWFEDNQEKYREVRQRKYRQMNDTWGRLVPIEDLRAELGSGFAGPFHPAQILMN